MKIRQILFSALCALCAVSCVEDATEDVLIGPDGQTYFTMSFSATSISAETKLGFNPTEDASDMIYWTSSEDITIVDTSNSYKEYTDQAVSYTEPADGSSPATFSISGFEVPSGSTEIKIFATSGSVATTGTGASSYTVTLPNLTMASASAAFDYDTFAEDLPFISPVKSANIVTANGSSIYSGDAPELTLLPIFHAMKINLSNINTSNIDEKVTSIKATITLDNNIFNDALTVSPSSLSYSASSDGAVNSAVTSASTKTLTSTKSVTTTVTYDVAQSSSNLTDLVIPVVTLGTSEAITGKNFTVTVEFLDTADATLAKGEKTYQATGEFMYGVVDNITLPAENYTYDLNITGAVTGISLEAVTDSYITPQIEVEWEYPADTDNIAGVNIYYGTATGDYEDTPAYIEYGSDGSTTSYLLGSNETLEWNTEYFIKIATVSTDADGTETFATEDSEETIEETDIRQNDSNDYEIYNAAGLVAFAEIVNGSGDVGTTPTNVIMTRAAAAPSANAKVMKTIDCTDINSSWSSIKDYQGTFDGGNGLTNENSTETGITIKNFAPASGECLFGELGSGATIQNITLTDIDINGDGNIGAIASTLTSGNSATISYCNVASGTVSSTTNAGGLIGFVGGTITIEYSNNSATVEVNDVVVNGLCGFIGAVDSSANITLTDCEDTVAENSANSSVSEITVAIVKSSDNAGINVRWTAVPDSNDYVSVYYSTSSNGDYILGAVTAVSAGEANVTELQTSTKYYVSVITSNYLWKTTPAKLSGGSDATAVEIDLTAASHDIVYSSDTYQIYTAKGLMAFAGIVNGGNGGNKPDYITTDTSITWSNTADPSAKAEVMADLDMSGETWTPMVSYTGTFDGGNESRFEIQNLKGSDGLFSSITTDATIKNVTLSNVEITATDKAVGAVANTMTDGTITDCTVSGEVSSTTQAGGIVGTATAGTITDATNSATVTVGGVQMNYLYGIVGESPITATLTTCLDTTIGEVENVTTAVTVTDVESTLDGTGIIVTWDDSGVTAENDYVVVSYTPTSGDTYTAVAHTSADTMTITENITKDTDYTVTVETANYLYSATSKGSNTTTESWTVKVEVATYDLLLNGTTYQIYTAEGLRAFASLVNGASYSNGAVISNGGVLTVFTVTAGSGNASADALVKASITDVGTWTTYAMTSYAGTFDGGNGLSASNSTESGIKISGLTGAQGLFASTASGATIKCVTIDATITATANTTGILVSSSAGGTVSYCNTSGSIAGGQQYTSGIVGANSAEITIEYCTNSATVSGTNNIAGILGSRSAITYINYCNNYGTITATAGSAGGVSGYGSDFNASAAPSCEMNSCSNYGYIKGTTSVGGIVGTLRGGKVSDCYNEGTISGGVGAGGIIGVTQSYTVTITSSSNAGIINATGNNVGGILGSIDKTTTIAGTGSNRGAVNSESATATGVGGIVGNLTSSGTLSGDYTNYANVTLGGTLTLNSDGIADDVITGGTSINDDDYGVIGSGSVSSNVTGTCTDEYDPNVDTSSNPVTVTSCAVDGTTPTTVNITWSYGDGYENISSVKVYYKTSADATYSLYGSIATSGTNSVTTTSLTGLTDDTIYNIFVVTVDNTESEVAAVGGGSQASPLYAMIGTAAGLDLIYYSTATTTYVANTFAINSDKGLYAFADIVNGNDNTSSATAVNSNGSPYTFTESANTTVNGVVTTSIALSTTANSWDDYAMTAYAGTFDGGNGGASSTGIAITDLTGSKGLFSTTSGATIKNLTIAVNVSSTVKSTGGIVDTATSTTFSYCNVLGVVKATEEAIGGFVGTAATAITIKNCKNTATIGASDSKYNNSAGFIGSATATISIADCENDATIYGGSTVGGIMGYCNVSTSSAGSITNTKNKGTIIASSTDVGGFIGNFRANSTNNIIEDCTNEATITGTEDVGGIVGGYHSNGVYTIKHSSNSGAITGTSNVGGLVGSIQGSTIDGSDSGSSGTSSNTGVVKATTDVTTVGGIVGNVGSGTLTLSNYINAAAVYTNTSTLVNGASGAASIVGSGTVTDTNCSDSYYTTANP